MSCVEYDTILAKKKQEFNITHGKTMPRLMTPGTAKLNTLGGPESGGPPPPSRPQQLVLDIKAFVVPSVDALTPVYDVDIVNDVDENDVVSRVKSRHDASDSHDGCIGRFSYDIFSVNCASPMIARSTDSDRHRALELVKHHGGDYVNKVASMAKSIADTMLQDIWTSAFSNVNNKRASHSVLTFDGNGHCVNDAKLPTTDFRRYSSRYSERMCKESEAPRHSPRQPLYADDAARRLLQKIVDATLFEAVSSCMW